MPWYDGAGNIITPANFADLGFTAPFAQTLFGTPSGTPAIPELSPSSSIGGLVPPVLVDTLPFMSGTPDPFPPVFPLDPGGFLPGQLPNTPGIPGDFPPLFLPPLPDVPQLPGMIPSDRMPTVSSPGQVQMINGRCVITQFLPARTVHRKARIIGCNAAGPICVPARRKMNALNPHALQRALRRASRFAKFAKKAVRITTRMKLKKGFRGPARRKKAKTCA